MQIKLHTGKSQVILMILIPSPYLFLKNVIFRHGFVHEFMVKFVHKFVDEFFVTFVHEFKYEIRANSYEFFAQKIGYVMNGLYCINASSQVLNIVSGYEIPFVKEPYQYHHPMTQANSDEERILTQEEINNLLAKDAIEEILMSELYYSSSMFLVTKKSGGKRPVLNLKPLNKFVPNQTLKMEGIHLLKDFLKPNYFMTKLDLSDAHYSIPIDKHSRHYLQFTCIFEGKLYQFKVLVFGLNTAPRIFSKCMKPVVAFIRSKGILIIIYLDDILLAAQTYHECLCQTIIAIDLLESLGFCINREKSQLIPSQHIPFLGFVVDSTTMTTGLPLEKIASIQSLAVTLKESSQPVTLRSLSRFIGICTATHLAVFQAPAHYLHLQFLKNSVLQNSSKLNWVYNRKVSLNQAAKEDLVWWINHLSQNSTQPIILPSPNKIITTDSSDFRWGYGQGEIILKDSGQGKKQGGT